MIRSCVRRCSAMSSDPAFHLFLNECSSAIGKGDGHASSKTRGNVAAALALLGDDNTVPFIARYRREQTGDIDVSDLYELQRKWEDFVSMAKLRQSRLAALDASGKLTEDIRKAFNECICKEDLDELYSSYKETKTAKSEVINSFQVEEIAHDIVEGKLRHTFITAKMAEIASSAKYSVAEAIVYHCTNHLFADLDVKMAAKEQLHKFPTMVNTSLTTAYKALQKDLQDGGSKPGHSTQFKHTASKDASAAPPPKASELNKYRDYHSVHRRITQLAAHQLLAIRRGKEAGVLSITLSPDENAKANILRFMHQKFKCFPSSHHTDPSASLKLTAAGSKIVREDVMSLASKEAVSKLCAASTKKQWKDAMTAAEVEAAEVFSTSLRPLLLTAPLRLVVDHLRQQSLPDSASQIVVCAVDPGFAHGHKWVILSQGQSVAKSQDASVRAKGEDTNILCYGKIFEKSSASSGSGSTANRDSPIMLQSAAQLAELLQRYKVDIVAVGNGTASREAQVFVASALQHVSSSSRKVSAESDEMALAKAAKRKRDDIEGTQNAAAPGAAGCLGYVVVSEAGASVYSASERAREEFPPEVLDISYVGAVSIGRRLVDPLSELVKVQPASLGVGMYQHDLSDKGITERLRNVVEDCVNTVGIDINTASSDLLRYVSGLSEANVREIISHRTATAGVSSTAATSGKAKKGTSGGHSGRLECLADLKSIKGIGPKTFRNCAGFMRVYNGSEPLDVTNIHPDDYDVARLMLELHRNGRVGRVGASASEDVSAGSSKKQKVDERKTVSADIPTSTDASSLWSAFLQSHPAQDASAAEGSKKKALSSDPYAVLRAKSGGELAQIWTWLQEAGLVRDGSAQKHSTGHTAVNGPFMSLPKVQRGIPEDFHVKIEVGSVVPGVIRNVTTFGAFVDLGGVEIGGSKNDGGAKGKGKVSCDGLLHCSKYRDYAKRQPVGAQQDANAMSKEIYVGREVKVKILTIEEVDGGKESGKGGHHEKRRIALDLIELL